MRPAVIAMAVLLGACDQLPPIDLPFLNRDGEAGDAGIVGGSGSTEGFAPMAEPGDVRRAWRPAEERAAKVTGNLTVSLPEGRNGPLVLAFANGLTYRLSPIGIQLGADQMGGGAGTFAAALAAPRDAGVFMYRTLEEGIDEVAPAGGFCGAEPATFVAIAEFVGADGEWSFVVTPFKGAQPPGPVADRDPGVCGRYVYRLR